MQLGTEFMAILPDLRRYARALTGSQSAGDEIVIRTLESLTKGPRLSEMDDAKLAIFRLLSRLWNGAIGEHLRSASDQGCAGLPADERLATLGSYERQAFLLVSMERFSEQDAADILSLSEDEFSAYLQSARILITRQLATDVLIIEDELFIATQLETIMTQLGHRVSNVVRTHQRAVEAMKSSKPGLILADIQLADNSNGIEAVQDILKEQTLPVIFVTAFPERLLTGTRPEPTFLITKPFGADEVRGVVSQALFFKSNAALSEDARVLVSRTADK